MNRREILDVLNAEHRALLVLVQTFTPEDFEKAARVGEWSAKDLFGHIAFWNGEAATAIDQVAHKQRPVMMLDKDDDVVNAREIERRRSLPLHRVMEEYRRTQLALISAVQRTAERDLHRKSEHVSADGKDANAAWIAGGIIEHYEEHRAELARARRD